jgi:hypothetical protein
MGKKSSRNKGIDPVLAAEILRRIDILAEAKKYGFVPLGPPDTAGWVPGRGPGLPCGLLNIGWGPERGNFVECNFAGLGCLARCSSKN